MRAARLQVVVWQDEGEGVVSQYRTFDGHRADILAMAACHCPCRTLLATGALPARVRARFGVLHAWIIIDWLDLARLAVGRRLSILSRRELRQGCVPGAQAQGPLTGDSLSPGHSRMLFFTGDADGCICIWNLYSGERKAVLRATQAAAALADAAAEGTCWPSGGPSELPSAAPSRPFTVAHGQLAGSSKQQQAPPWAARRTSSSASASWGPGGSPPTGSSPWTSPPGTAPAEGLRAGSLTAASSSAVGGADMGGGVSAAAREGQTFPDEPPPWSGVSRRPAAPRPPSPLRPMGSTSAAQSCGRPSICAGGDGAPPAVEALAWLQAWTPQQRAERRRREAEAAAAAAEAAAAAAARAAMEAAADAQGDEDARRQHLQQAGPDGGGTSGDVAAVGGSSLRVGPEGQQAVCSGLTVDCQRHLRRPSFLQPVASSGNGAGALTAAEAAAAAAAAGPGQGTDPGSSRPWSSGTDTVPGTPSSTSSGVLAGEAAAALLLLAGAGDGRVHVWRVDRTGAGRLLFTLPGARGRLRGCGTSAQPAVRGKAGTAKGKRAK
jgi:hypothetical protein